MVIFRFKSRNGFTPVFYALSTPSNTEALNDRGVDAIKIKETFMYVNYFAYYQKKLQFENESPLKKQLSKHNIIIEK